MKDIINSIKVHLHEKSTSPLFGAFALSWVAWNYKFIFVLLSSLKITEKFEYIKTALYPSILDNLLWGGLYPFITAVCFILIYPYPAELIYSYWKTKQKRMNEVRQRIEGDTLLSIKESQDIRRKIDEIEFKHNEELAAKDKKVSSTTERYSEELEKKEKQLEELSKQYEEEMSVKEMLISDLEKKSVEKLQNLTEKEIIISNRMKAEKALSSSNKSSKMKQSFHDDGVPTYDINDL